MKVPESVQRSATDNFGLTTSLVNAEKLEGQEIAVKSLSQASGQGLEELLIHW
ncbi:Serine/Threonine kinase; kinase; ATP-binding; sugar-binding; kinase; carbohydrate-binding protein [Arabidopsis thaliana]|jgi:hypothetical protein|uniref:Serine/Threonine kinase kinase ATP-binding sugar-binding kinase carbohydrate-binding protein n=2 Tax=Arabidopsis thaliana TaxID=3702 RepID=Q1G3Y2_ARATH|nr:Serine/Threonine kinase; kinase; ATP-binding; sugar-binding; kinase; carbohydrate-binding protein [Arabidopsis thaliana]NP_001319286.1 Serine/Threonine kinase; kinase; ATP-binding; sugar-binding; kinase; carbohydrate-binding protein [Arabidopsis thaliana]ABF59182.1 unknown protein [Arabidopsis thaliana]AEE33858.1 Serine/Threonine kinase; kinase; ATP-binding; sugar-binding; kinase; carbohydrate-binding protein [Arabidopsis thaliana]ANM58446.1 Serine/Threonine kinase; kinase; ATP-binding; suga|eukprot:NP_001077755.1 Serine/Threonine kinase; kinase; ATP-binding; sugar-binding; kinase; carbohydrate-binding protein [Arabidopsis thaliana]